MVTGEQRIRIGFDIGGSKLAVIALGHDGDELACDRCPVPRAYPATLDALVAMTARYERARGDARTVGIALPGMIGADGELVRVVNLPWLEGRPLRADLQRLLGLPVAIANDANCFALSEAMDGAAAGAAVVFGVILGTGVGGGIVVGGRVIAGANAIAGEWGHNPLPETGTPGPAQLCGCGRRGCIETWLNGAALARDYRTDAGLEVEVDAAEVARRAVAGDRQARAAMARYEERLAAALAGIINILDPDVIALGGGLASIDSLYRQVPKLWSRFCVAPQPKTRLVRARFGPESGLRGAAWLGASG